MDQDRDQCHNLGSTREHNTTTYVKSRKLDIGNYKIEDFVALDTFYISCIVNVEMKFLEFGFRLPTQTKEREQNACFRSVACSSVVIYHGGALEYLDSY